MKAISINKEQNLYIIPEGDGYSCLGFEILERRLTKLAAELNIIVEPVKIGTSARYNQYEKLIEIAAARNKQTGWRSSSELTPELIELEGKKVKVTHQWPSGAVEVSKFTVGKSTGFIPCHLEIKTKRSSGGGAVCFGKILSVEVLQ